MGRKKFYTQEPPKAEIEKPKVWQAGLYLRLSNSKDYSVESDSISNQRLLLTSYVNEIADMTIVDAYIDDGLTGLNFDRPSFSRMMSDVINGRIDCIIVKDLSRLGRDTIEVRNLLEIVLPSHDCRFISVAENIDTHLRPNATLDLTTHFTQFINEHYSSEISRNIRMAFDTQRKEGKFVGGFAPYGYIKNPENRYKIIIDEEAAKVVREIFRLCLSGMGVICIAQHLNTLNIDCPSLYKRKKGLWKRDTCNIGEAWRPNAIRKILSNKIYIGHLEQKKWSKDNYRSPKWELMPEEKRIVVYNTHEPIISKEDFKKVQEYFNKCTRTPPQKQRAYLFSGLLRCADCNGAMVRSSRNHSGKLYVYYKCRTYNQISDLKCTKTHSIRHEELAKVVFNTVKSQIYAVANLSNVLNRINISDMTRSRIKMLNSQLARSERELEKKSREKLGLYRDWKQTTISHQDYLLFTQKNIEETNALETAIKTMKNQIEKYEEMSMKDLNWMKDYMQYFDQAQLTRIMLLSLVDKIYISSDKHIRIVFRYEDELADMMDFVGKNDEVLEHAK